MHSANGKRLTQDERERLQRERARDEFILLVRTYCQPDVTPDDLARALETLGWRGPDDLRAD
jgi:hypothetical protein